MTFNRKDLLGIEDLNRNEIEHILKTAESFIEVTQRKIKKVPALRGKTIVNLFFENSTGTRTSFEIAAKRLSADVINFTANTSSATKGESLIDTAKNIDAMQPDIIVCRHASSGSSHLLAKHLKASIVNAGDGAHEHPSQALLDLMTIVSAKKRPVAGLRVAIVGDIAHSRVARSNIHCLKKMGASVVVAGPASMIPKDIERLGVDVSYNLQHALENADVVMMLRIQMERMSTALFPSLGEYASRFGLNSKSIKHLKPDALILHPGPVNRGVEIDPEVADGPYSVILDQVTNGVAMRMAILYVLAGATESNS